MKVHGWSRPDTSGTSTAEADNWQKGAPCTVNDPIIWYPTDGQSGARAKALCAGCHVTARCRIECDDYETGRTDRHGIHGVWAGETVDERLRRRRAAA